VDAASAGDTIEVRSGVYVENVDVDKQLTLIGEGADVVTVRAADASDHVFNVTADWVNVSGFNATGAMTWKKMGIHLNSVNHCNISENNASNNHHGIYIEYSKNTTLTSNIANSNNGYGILLSSSNNNTLESNNVSNNGQGIHIDFSSNYNSHSARRSSNIILFAFFPHQAQNIP